MTPEVKERIEQLRHGIVPDGYKKTAAGIIPVDWQCSTIRDCLQIKNNERKPISEEVRKTIPGPYPYYGPTQAQGFIDTFVSEGLAVLIGEDGDHFLKYKDKPMTLLVDGQYTVNNHAHMVVGTKKCTTKWFSYAYQHKSLLNAITRQGAGRYKLTKEALEKLFVQYPCLEEQRILIDIISAQDKVIELKEKLLAEKQRQKKYLMQQLLTGKKRLPGFDGEWMYVRANQIFRNVTDKKHNGTLEVLSATQDRGIIPRSLVDIDIKYAKESLTGYKKVVKGNFVISLRSFQGGIEYSEYSAKRESSAVRIDKKRLTVFIAGEKVRLTEKELKLFSLLYENRDKAVSDSEIVEKVFGSETVSGSNIAAVYVNYLRKKLDERLGKRMIYRVRGEGYLLKIDERE